MQVDDRVSLAFSEYRYSASANPYHAEVIRFGASDAVALIAAHYHWEGTYSLATEFRGMALSRNPEHELNPPAEIAAWFEDRNLYARGQLIRDATRTNEGNMLIASLIVPLYGIIVPSRQIVIHMRIGGGTYGQIGEFYYHEVKLSRQEANLMNITWGKYRR